MARKMLKPFDYIEVGKDVDYKGQPYLVIQLDSQRREVQLRPYNPLEEPLKVSFDCVGLLEPRSTPRGPNEPAIHVISGADAEALIRDGVANLIRDGIGVRPPNSITIIDISMEIDPPGHGGPFPIAVTFESGLRDDIDDYLNSTEVQ